MEKTTEKIKPEMVYSIEQFCQEFSMTQTNFFRLNKRGKAPKSVMVGGRRYMRKKTVEEWLIRLEKEQNAV